MPSGLAAASTTVRVLKGGVVTGIVGVSVDATAPSLATADASGKGQAAALNQDQSINSPANPGPHGSIVTLFASGAGQWSTSLPDGQITGTTLTTPAAPVLVRVGKFPAAVLYAGSAPGQVNGVLQVNFQLPLELLGGSAIPVQVIAGNLASLPGTTFAVQ